jgi:pyruvate dehydrogenase E2 component (dihydrolipoamide acetyltransferase)
MAVPVTVPRATISMEQGKIIAWLKKEGDPVQLGETILELETDKALFEVPSPAEGVLVRVLLEQGDVAVESVIGWIGEPGETVPDGQPPVPKPAATDSLMPMVAEPREEARRIVATPAARRRAVELRVDLARVKGTGPAGRITQEDVETLVQSVRGSSRTGLAKQLMISWQNVPHIHICRRLNAGPLVEYRATARARGMEITFTDLLLFTVARTLLEFVTLRSVWDGEQVVPGTRMNIGFAVDAGDTVLTPVLEDADALSLDDLASKRRVLAKAAREKRLKASAEAAFTITNLGMYGVDLFAPVIRAPETAMLAVGRVTQEPVVRDGVVVAGWTVWTNLAVDHRVTDGATAARFLEALERRFADLKPIP